jgi:hypothetical protein
LIFVLPFHSWAYDVGLKLTIYQIVTILIIISTLFLSSKGKKNLFYVGNFYIVFFFLYSVINTIVISLFFIDEFRELGGFFRSEGRYLSQIVLLAVSFSILPIAFNYIKEVKDIQKYLKVYLFALGFLAALGWVQFSVYSFSGIDIFPLNINQFGEIRSGLYDIEEIRIFRMSSLGGEPKGFSISLIMGFFIIHVFNAYGISFFKHDRRYKYLFLLTAFSTLSTSGIVLFSILFIFYVLYALVKIRKLKEVRLNKIIFPLLIFLTICFTTYPYWNIVSSIIEERVFGRDLISEDFDAPIQTFLIEFPQYFLFGSGLGNIHNLAHPFIPNNALHYMGESLFVAKSGYLRLVSELGLVGFSIFIYIVYSTYRKCGEIGKYSCLRYQQVLSAMQLLLIIALLAYFARTYVLGEFILFLAMANVMVNSKKIRREIFG